MSDLGAASLIEFLQSLVRARSVFEPQAEAHEAAAAAVVADRMRGFGWSPVITQVAPGRPNVIAVIEGATPGPTLMFEGHIDVVTEGDPAQWTHPPFAADIVDGRLYGRGAADMKGGVAAMLFGVAALTAGGLPRGRIVVAALSDEEGMMLGVKDFVRTSLAREVDAAIVCEPEGGEICISQKGAIRLRIDARGRMAHGAMPDHGANPLTPLGHIIVDLERLERELQARHGPHPHLGLPFITPTAMLAGSLPQLNVIPESAWIAVDIRTTPSVDHGALLARIARECEARGKETGTSITLSTIDDRPATETPEDHPVVRAVAGAHQAITGRNAPFGGVPGSTDGTILWRDAAIPIVTYGPGDKWIAHQVDEFVEVDEVVRYAQVYAEAARLFLEDRGV
jgi:succinyl-diaminopimelate desuccinylase